MSVHKGGGGAKNVQNSVHMVYGCHLTEIQNHDPDLHNCAQIGWFYGQDHERQGCPKERFVSRIQLRQFFLWRILWSHIRLEPNLLN